MHLKILLAVLMLVFGSFNCGVFGQTKITFVDSSGAPVPTVDAVFFNGGQGQTIEIKNGSGTVQASKGVVAATAKGFQYSGGILDSKDLKIVLLRVDEVASSVRQEQVAPEKVRSMIWEVVFRAIPRSSLLAENQMLQHTAGAIARYDHDLALALIDIDNLEIRTWPKSGGFHQAILQPMPLKFRAQKHTNTPYFAFKKNWSMCCSWMKKRSGETYPNRFNWNGQRASMNRHFSCQGQSYVASAQNETGQIKLRLASSLVS